MAPRTGRLFVSPDKALALFQITPFASLRDLNASYRKLVRRYHPDHHPDRAQWAHEAMTKINAAYDSAVEYLGRLRYEEVEAHLDREIQAHDEFTQLFLNIANRVLEGVFTYYQYGLENPHQRRTGTPRQRYRQAVRRIAAALEQLESLRVPNPVDGETLQTFRAFSQAFFHAMQIDRAYSPVGSSDEHRAYRRYSEGSRSLDVAIRRSFFREEFSHRREIASPQSLAVSLNEFMAVVTHHGASSWVTETAVKLRLLDSFQALLAISDRLPELGI